MPGPHDFAVRINAVRLARLLDRSRVCTRPATSCAHDIVASTASRTYVRDDRDTPLVDEAGWADLRHISDKTNIEIFFAWGLDDPNQLDPAQEFRFYAHAIFDAVEGAIAIACGHFCLSGKSLDEGDSARDPAAPFTPNVGEDWTGSLGRRSLIKCRCAHRR